MHETVLDLITYGMAINLHVFCVFMEHGVVSNMCGRFVVAEQLSRGTYNDLQVFEKLMKPQKFTCNKSHASVLCFSTIFADCFLLLRLPVD